YSFRVLDVGAQPVLNLNAPVAGTVDPGTRADLYRFTGTAGQRLFFDWQSGFTYSDFYYLYGPGDESITWSYFGSSMDVTLPSGGAYTLVLWGRGTSPADYKFQVLTPTTTTTPLTLGSTVSGALKAAGQVD